MVVAVAATESVTEEADILFVSCNQKKTMKIGKQILVEILERERKAGGVHGGAGGVSAWGYTYVVTVIYEDRKREDKV